MATSGVLFEKGSIGDNENVWDDSELISAYDSAIKSFKERIGIAHDDNEETENIEQERLNPSNNFKYNYKRKKRRKNKKIQWKNGMKCSAKFSEDQLFYDAVINKIDYSKGTCVVTYIGYGNEEVQYLCDLQRSSDNNRNSFSEKESISECDMHSISNQSFSSCAKSADYSSPSIPPFMLQAPPISLSMPPPHPPDVNIDMDSSTKDLRNMLLAWYMSGYHTGYYQGSKSKSEKS